MNDNQSTEISRTVSIEEKDNTIFIGGYLNELAKLSSLFEGKTGIYYVDMCNLNMINSCGVAEWVKALRNIAEELTVVYINCSCVVVEQFSMIPEFLQKVKVKSFYGRYFCEECNKEQEVLLNTLKYFKEGKMSYEAPEMSCDDCGEEMEFDDLENEYFLFLTAKYPGRSVFPTEDL